MDLLLQSDQLAAQTPSSRSRPGAPLSPTNNIPGSTPDSTTLTKTAFRKKHFHALYPRAEADLHRKDTSSSQLSRPVIPRAWRTTFPAQRKQRNSSIPREQMLGFRADVLCPQQSLQSSSKHQGGPFGPILMNHTITSWFPLLPPAP